MAALPAVPDNAAQLPAVPGEEKIKIV